MRLLLIPIFLLLIAQGCLAGEVKVVAVTAEREVSGTYRFDVTLAHADAGWDHYADRWEVLSSQGEVLAVRTLYHPHVEEQPFTRSLSGVRIAAGTERVLVRAHDSVHGDGPALFEVVLP